MEVIIESTEECSKAVWNRRQQGSVTSEKDGTNYGWKERGLIGSDSGTGWNRGKYGSMVVEQYGKENGE